MEQSKFFLDRDTLDELRAKGVVPTSPAAYRWLRCGAIFLVIGLIDWPAFKFNLPAIVTITLIPLLTIFCVGLAATKGFFSFKPPPAPKSSPLFLPTIISTALVLGVLISCAAWISSLKFFAALPGIIQLLVTHPLQVVSVAQRLVAQIGASAVVVGLLLIGIEILSFHRRNQPSPGGGHASSDSDAH